jgi:hypothetical protein
MDIVTRRAHDAFPGVGGELPVIVLLAVPFGKLIGIYVFDFSTLISIGFIV